MELNDEQQLAIDAINKWLDDPADQFFLLSGAAGTGKTYTVQALINSRLPMAFTAPTNKATKVLREMLTTDDYNPVCHTTYSLLGLRLEASGELKELKASDKVIDLRKYRLIVVDESSMISLQLWEELQSAADRTKTKFLMLGDRNQLPPVKERFSPIWEYIERRADLTKVMRFDNQILALAGRIRAQVDSLAPSISLTSDNDEIEGIWKLEPFMFIQRIQQAARAGDFSNNTKAIAWRNATVDKLNKIIRNEIFDNAGEHLWLVGDRIILTAPAMDLEGQQMASTDDEGTIEAVQITMHPTHRNLQCYRITVMGDNNRRWVLWVLHDMSKMVFEDTKKAMAARAKSTPRLWKDFWKYVDSLHQIRYSYAITAHRAQGSTYEKTFVDWKDILTSRNRNEAFRCLYVACTRAKHKLILGTIV